MKNSTELQQTPEYQIKLAERRKRRQKLTKTSRRITRQHGQTKRPATR